MVSKNKKQLLERKAAMLANTLTHKFLDAKNSYRAPSDDEVMSLAKDFKKEKSADMKATYDYPAPKTPSDDEEMTLEKAVSKDRLDTLKDTMYKNGVLKKAEYNGVSPEDTDLDPVMSLSKVERDEYNKDMEDIFGTSDEFVQSGSDFDAWIDQLLEPEDFADVLGEGKSFIRKKPQPAKESVNSTVDADDMEKKLFDFEPEDTEEDSTEDSIEKMYTAEPEDEQEEMDYHEDLFKYEPEDTTEAKKHKKHEDEEAFEEDDGDQFETDDGERYGREYVSKRIEHDDDEYKDLRKKYSKVEEAGEPEEAEDKDANPEDYEDEVTKSEDEYDKTEDLVDPNDEGYFDQKAAEEKKDEEPEEDEEEPEENEEEPEEDEGEEEPEITDDLIDDLVDAILDKFEDLGLVVLDGNKDLKELSSKVADALENNYNVITDGELQGYTESVVKHTLATMQKIQEDRLTEGMKNLGKKVKKAKELEAKKAKELKMKKVKELEAKKAKEKELEAKKVKHQKPEEKKVEESLDTRRFKDFILRQLNGKLEPSEVAEPSKAIPKPKKTNESVEVHSDGKKLIEDVNFIGNKIKTEKEIKPQSIEFEDATIKLLVESEKI